MARPLQRGDVLSYSAGSTNRGPDGFRVVATAEGPRPSALLTTLVTRWPELGALLGGPRPPMFLNAYPADVGRFDAGVVVDTYLSPRTLSRALQLAAREELPVVLMAQPLFAADALLDHLRRGLPLPPALVLGVGGYPLLPGLQRALETWLTDCTLHVLHFYGLAEIDAAMLIGRERCETGEVRYLLRPDVRAHVEADTLWISRQARDGSWPEPVSTRDRARPDGDGFIFPGAAGRAADDVLAALQSWTPEEWARRTGYVARDGDHLCFQTRAHHSAHTPDELGFWRFGERFGFSWLDKPVWR